MKVCACAFVVALALMGSTPAAVAVADGGGTGTGSSACPGGQAQWTGTRTAPTAYTIDSSANIQCYSPQVNTTAGDTGHATNGGSPQPAGPCAATVSSHVAVGPLLPNGKRTVSWWDPNSQTVTSTTIADNAADQAQSGFLSEQGTEPVSFASWWMGSDAGTIPWKTTNATWVNGVCTGQWQQSFLQSCGYTGPVYSCSPVAAVQPVAPLAYAAPPPVVVAPLLAGAEAQVQQQLRGGQVTSEFASGSVVPKHGLIVRVPVCFWAPNATVASTKQFGLVAPQAGLGRALVVNYVAAASEDQTWWDFGDGSSTTQTGVDSTQPCAVTHTYYRVSADAYGSLHNHTPPPGQTDPFPDSEPSADYQAVVVWHHIHFSLTAYYVQSDGTQYAVPVPQTTGADFWVPSQPEWVQVQQIESVPFVCPCPSPSAQ
jgi:hypothetical protein